MSELLDQNEIDALLSAVGDDSSGDDSGGGAATPAVFSNRGASHVDVSLYDFKRPERVSKDQMRALEALHEGFGRNLGAALSGYLRTIIEVSVASIEQLTYSEFIYSLPNPTCFNLLTCDALDGQVCLEISPLIIYPIIDRLLGGSNADLFIPQRPLTQIEQRLVSRITDRATHHLSEAWSNLTDVRFAQSDFESNPQLVQIVPPSETVVVIGFELKMGNRAGTMSLCVPYTVMEPVIPLLTRQTNFTYAKKGRRDDLAPRVRRNVDNAPLEMTAVLANTTMKLGDLLSLAPGDVITTGKPSDTPMSLQVEGRTKFRGQIGQYRGNKAFRVTQALPIDQDEGSGRALALGSESE
ncbi:MAG: flagellar motor switch protein FliM [Planctomycetota bacterium]